MQKARQGAFRAARLLCVLSCVAAARTAAPAGGSTAIESMSALEEAIRKFSPKEPTAARTARRIAAWRAARPGQHCAVYFVVPLVA
jgi:hypothetical protein